MQSQADEVLASGGEMGRLVRSMDWSKTPLGPMDSWPQSLRTTVSLALASNFPISIAWGPHRVQIYNDGYWPLCGDKHPTSMGQDYKECWLSAWPVIGEAFEKASRGESQFLVNQRMFLDRHGYLEETFFTFSFSPILDETGGVGGLFHPVTELTQQSLAERRLKVTRDIADHAFEARSVEEASGLIQETLSDHGLDLPFVLVYLVDGSGAGARLAVCSGVACGSALAPEAVDLDSDSGWPFREVAHSKQPLQVDHLEERFGSFACGPYPEPPRAAMVSTLVMAGVDHPFAFIVAGVSARRALDPSYLAFHGMLRDTLANIYTGARSYAEERRRAEALAELDRAKIDFFSNVSHEFRTPLTLMLGPIEDLLQPREDTLSMKNRATISVLHRNSLRLLKLVNTLLDFSRIEAGRVHASYEPTDLAALTADLASTFRSAIERAGMELVVDCPPLPEPVYVDQDMWEKIVLNLLSNAFKFTLKGRIAVRLAAVDDHVELTVRDTGAGIAPEDLPNLFQRFNRIRGVMARTHEGTGIGLALVQELARLHGGTVRAESKVGEGSEFTVSLPGGKAHLPANQLGVKRSLESTALGARPFVEEALRWLPGKSASEAPPERPGLPGIPAARIVFADDNADLREYVTRLLREHWEVEAVEDGEKALAAVRRQAPDLVLADIMMPGLDGLGLLRVLRSNPDTRSLPVILLSARAGSEAALEGLDTGADDYLVKPFSASELVARVRTHILMHRARQEAETSMLEMREQMWQSQKLEAIGKLAGGIAHDFNNLLTAINGYTELSLNLLGPEQEARPFLEEVQKAGKRAASLTSQILAYSRRQIVTPRALALDAIVAEMETLLRRLLPENVELVRDIHPGEWAVLADRSQVEQVLMNVVLNAADAMPDGGRIFIALSHAELGKTQKGFQLTSPPGNYVVLSIRDEGWGMGEEILAHLFEPFFTSKDKGKGTGLGLATVYGILKQSLGAIRVESAPKQGTTFHLYLPETEGADPTPPAPAAAVTGGSALAKETETILLAEDEDMVRGYVAEILRKAGYRVLEASNGRDAIRQHEGSLEAVALLLTDVIMPDMGGRELADWFLERRPDARVLFMSGYIEDDVLRRGIRNARADFIGKPFSTEELTGKIRAVLEKVSGR